MAGMSKRYPDSFGLRSQLDPFQDVLALCRGLQTAETFLPLVREKHKQHVGRPKVVAAEAAAHVRVAMHYVDQAQRGPVEVAFLPLYYAALNLLKVYVVLGPHRNELPQQRWHGVSYDTKGKESRHLLTEQVTLHPRGAIPLFHRTVVGSQIPAKRVISMGDVYPFITDVGAEYQLLTGKPSQLLAAKMFIRSAREDMKNAYLAMEPCLQLPYVLEPPTVRLLPTLPQGKWRKTKYTYKGPSIDGGRRITEVIREACVPGLLYIPLGIEKGDLADSEVLLPVCGRSLPFPEELPIALALFHLGSVARYRPEMLERLLQSASYPLMLALQRHALFKLLMLFWSFANQTNLTVHKE